MTPSRRFLAGVLALSLPLAATAQAAPAAAAPAADGIKLTPYGFILANGFFTGNSVSSHDYPGQAVAAVQGGAVLFKASQSRVGFKLATKEDWSGADLTGVVEFDFNAGQNVAIVNGNPEQARSTGWYNGLMRLRLASMTASWKTPAGTVSVLAGQDVGLVNTLFAESLAWVASPLFWQAGNIWRRSPQFRLGYANSFGDIGFNAAVAALSPATNDVPVDFGTGNQSRMPNIEARVGATAKFPMDVTVALGLGYHMNTRRLAYHTVNQQDVKGNLFGVDLDLGLTKYAQVKGEFYSGKGADDTYNSISAATFGPAGSVVALKSSGYWAQLIGKPIPWAWITLGFGKADADKSYLDAHAAGAARLTTRVANQQVAGGLLFNAGKSWRFGVEYAAVTSTYLGAAAGAATVDQKATQIGISSQLKF